MTTRRRVSDARVSDKAEVHAPVRLPDPDDLIEEIGAAAVINVRAAKARFSELLREAREGHPQLVGPQGEDPVLMISRDKLEAVLAGSPSALTAFCADMHPVDASIELPEGEMERVSFDVAGALHDNELER